jgi:hypothetical protein
MLALDDKTCRVKSLHLICSDYQEWQKVKRQNINTFFLVTDAVVN